MVRVISLASLVAYLFALYKFRGKWIQQQVFFLIIFLVGLTLVGELDVLLPIYFVVSLAPFITKIRRISRFTAFLSVYYLLYLGYGLINQDITGTIVTFIAKTWQFIVFFIVYDADIEFEESDYMKPILIAVGVETLLGIYLLMTSTMIDANGLARLVSNAQPITGNLSTAILPLFAYYYFKNQQNSRKTHRLLLVSVVMLVWIILSGTRGYTLEYGATMMLVFYDYFTNHQIRKSTQINRFITAMVLGIIALFVVILIPGWLARASSILRLRSSVGIRTYENAAIKEFLHNAPLRIVAFGIGLGGIGGSYSAMANALSEQFNLGMWNRAHYMSGSGALFHNLYANIAMCQGVLGIAVTIVICFGIWERITRSCANRGLIRKVLHLFFLSFLLMNYYRWSAVCGIGEMILFALVLKLIDQGNMDSKAKQEKTCL